ncbi:MAG: NTP transferase domain-containing protein, partial [Pseudomonadota bacterium]
MEMDKVAGVILAGGSAQRLGGGDKVLLSLAGRTLLSRIAEIVAPQVQG